MTYLSGKKDARWVRGAYYLHKNQQFFQDLPLATIDLILQNLLFLPKICYEAELVLTLIACTNLVAVWQFFLFRLQNDHHEGKNYEMIPYQFQGLEKQLRNNSDLAIMTLRQCYRPKNQMFRFTGGRLLYPTFRTMINGFYHYRLA